MKLFRDMGLARWRLSRKIKKTFGAFEDNKIYLIKTFAYAHSFKDRQFDDPFFGQVPNYLKSSGYNVLTIYDPVKCASVATKRSVELENVLPWNGFLRVADFIVVYWELVAGLFHKLPRSVEFSGRNISREFRFQYLRDSFNSNTFCTLLMYRAFRRIARQFNVSAALYTFEGNPWEKMLLLALRESEKTQILGYQHTVVPLASLSMFPIDDETSWTPFPDRVLTVGEIPSQILIEQGEYKEIPVTPSCAVRYQALEKIPMKADRLEKKLLVALEGVLGAAQLVEYILEHAPILKDWNITLRTHPALSLREMNSSLERRVANTSNIRLSNKLNVVDDLKDSSIAMYWGSTVALEALKMGLPLIHFDTQTLMNYDPLFSFSDFKWIANRQTNLSHVLNEILLLDSRTLELKRAQGRQFLDNYFYSVTEQNLKKFLEL